MDLSLYSSGINLTGGRFKPAEHQKTMPRTIFAVTLLAIALTVFGAVGATAQNTMRVVYDDGRASEELETWRIDRDSDALYLRANDVARVFKATQFWNASSRKVILGIGRARFTLTVDTRVVVIDGEPQMLRNVVGYDGGFVMIPLEFVLDVAAPYTPTVLDYNESSNTLYVEQIGYNVKGLTFATTANRSTATIELDEPLIYHFENDTPGLVRLKIYGGRIDPVRFSVNQARGLFDGVRAEQSDRDAFIYFDIKRYTKRVLIDRDEEDSKIVITLEKGDLPEIPDPDFAGKQPVEVVDHTRRARKKLNIETIVIDAGHGGKDHGKVGGGGLSEKEVNLAIALLTRRLIEDNLGLEVVLTREDDELLSLTRRAEIANQAGGDIFISIHCNSWFSPETGGFEAYFLSPASGEMEEALAMSENAVDDIYIGGGDAVSDIDFILWDIVQNEYINESSHFAELVQKEMTDRLDIRDRGVKQANFTVLQGARMPAILVEAAFLSNPREEAMLRDGDFHRQVAEGIVEAIRLFKERYR